MESVRLQKYFTDCGVMSRRAAEREIESGHVQVNGSTATLGQRIDPSADTVTWNGTVIRPQADERTYIMLHKPRGFLTTMSDDRGRRTVAQLTQDAGRRLYPIGRLDMDSDGLLLMTDDGALTLRLSHPRHEIPKIYEVEVKGTVSDACLAALNAPMTLDGYQLLPVKTERLSVHHHTTRLRMTLYEGRNRQIRRMCESQSLSVVSLSRVAIGQLTLGDLPVGRWRHLTPSEVAYLNGEQDTL
ncbi:MAG: rRNA pseudouridine synthase [Ruminococcaceae bacterium]|nr:rRNA pseudouridine synthase [Oscillospiraceae bacterium]